MATITQRTTDPWAEQFTKPDLEEARALKAVAVGEATSDQQKKALRWILHKSCGVSVSAFTPGQTDLTTLRLGRQAVGQDIQEILLTKAEEFRNGETD